MFIEPDFQRFQAGYDANEAQVVWSRLVADLETPVSAMLKLADGRPYSFLLESVEGGAVRGRYSIIGLKPDLIWRARGGAAEINRTALVSPETGFERLDAPPLDSLRATIAESRIDLPAELPPMAAGVFGYLGYDMVREMEHLPDVPPDALGLPDSILIRPTVMAIFDSVRDEVTIVTPVYPAPSVSAASAYQTAQESIAEVIAALDRPLHHQAEPLSNESPIGSQVSNTSPEEYMVMVERAK